MRELEVIDLNENHPPSLPGEIIPGNMMRYVLKYFSAQNDENEARRRKELARDTIKTWIKQNIEEDEDGNFVWQFDKPVIYDDNAVVHGLTLKRSITETINEEAAWELADSYAYLDDRCIKTVSEVDIDILYAMNAEGVIPDEEFDELFEDNVSYSLVRMTS